jgi:hypothetical protein
VDGGRATRGTAGGFGFRELLLFPVVGRLSLPLGRTSVVDWHDLWVRAVNNNRKPERLNLKKNSL